MKKKKVLFIVIFTYLCGAISLISSTQHWGYPATGQSPTWLFWALSGRFGLLINAWHLLISSVWILLLSFLGRARVEKSIKCASRFFFPFFIFWFPQGYPHLFPVGSRADCPRWLNVCGANLWRCWVSWSRGGAAHPAVLGICNFSALPTFFYSFHGSQRADTLFFCHLFFLLSPFPSLGLSWKIIIARWGFFLIIIIIIILWPGAFGSRGIFHPKGKDIPFTVKKVYIWCLFPPPAQIESSSIWGREAKPCWRERRCQRCFLRPGGAVSIPPPSSLVLSPT